MTVSSEEEEDVCNPIPMEEWFGEKDPESCKPCFGAPVVRWYADELRKIGQETVADTLTAQAEKLLIESTQEGANIDLSSIGMELDRMKNDFPSLATRLKEFDCAVQTTEKEYISSL